jgi:hypothetical protein
MRCMACGEEMRLVQVVPDDTMPVPGYEHHTLACPGCHDVERRLVFSRDLEPVPFEPRPLPPAALRAEAAAGRAARSSVEIPPDAVMASSSITAPSWARAVDRLRNQQSSLQARQADVKASATANQMRRDWQEAVRSRRLAQTTLAQATLAQATLAQATAAPVAPADRSRPSPAPSSAMARMLARLRRRDTWQQTWHQTSHQTSHQTWHQAAGGAADERRRFDQMWESFAPPTPAAAAASLPQPAAVGSKSLVPVAPPAGEAWSTVARAMTLLRAAP